MKTRNWLAVTASIGLVLGMFTASSAHATQSNCRPSSDIQASFAPNDCTLPYPDEGLSNDLDTCHQLSNIAGLGDLTDPGHDYLLDASIVGVTPSAIVQAPKVLNFKADVTSDCRRWAAYQLDGFVISPQGDKYPITFVTGSFRHFDPTYDTTNYCFLVFTGGCGYTSYSGSANLPTDAPTGSYSVLIHATSAGVASNSGLPIADKNYHFSNILEVTGLGGAPNATPTTAPTTAVPGLIDAPPFHSAYADNLLITTEITAHDAGIYLADTHATSWTSRIIDSRGNISVGKVGTFSGANNYILVWGPVTYGSYEIQLAGINAAGQGPWSVPELVVVPTPTPFGVPTVQVKKKITITCVGGKFTKKVTAVKPVCPKGYKRK